MHDSGKARQRVRNYVGLNQPAQPACLPVPHQHPMPKLPMHMHFFLCPVRLNLLADLSATVFFSYNKTASAGPSAVCIACIMHPQSLGPPQIYSTTRSSRTNTTLGLYLYATILIESMDLYGLLDA